jgi:hypothetical protein
MNDKVYFTAAARAVAEQLMDDAQLAVPFIPVPAFLTLIALRTL